MKTQKDRREYPAPAVSAPGRPRSDDPLLKRQLLFQLSYGGKETVAQGAPRVQRQTLPASFDGKYAITESGCWEWAAARQTNGYGSVWIGNGRTALAHRVAYEALVGPIPDGLTIDHLCRNKACINPAHMEPVTAVENIQRAHQAVATCKAGHPLTQHPRKNQRWCQICDNARHAVRQRAAYARKAAA